MNTNQSTFVYGARYMYVQTKASSSKSHRLIKEGLSIEEAELACLKFFCFGIFTCSGCQWLGQWDTRVGQPTV